MCVYLSNCIHSNRDTLDRRKQESYNLLIYAVKEGDPDTVQKLLAAGLSVNSVDYDKRTTLHMACLEGNVKIVDTLIEAGKLAASNLITCTSIRYC